LHVEKTFWICTWKKSRFSNSNA